MCQLHILAQDGIRLNSPEAMPSLTLFSKSDSVYLINNCGYIVNLWDTKAGFPHPKLLKNGNILTLFNMVFIHETNWEGEIVSETLVNLPESYRLTYELIKLPNENYLSIARRELSIEDFYSIGYDPASESNRERPLEIDVILEIEILTGQIVWEWNIGDHVIQERDSAAPNYGVVKDNPQLINIDAISDHDWRFGESFMINGFDYNQNLDQIIVSVRKLSEVMIIDHSTTTAQASGHSGGNSGMGGDILYRWGNPENYNLGDSTNRYLYFQHNPNWIHHGEHEGKVIIFDNGFSRTGNYSTIPIINPLMDINGNYIRNDNMAFGPTTPSPFLERINNDSLFSEYTSGVRLLENGNYFITVGNSAELKEVNPEGDLVWIYNLPSSGVFQTEKYPLNYLGFEGKDLSPSNYKVPGDDSDYDCELFTTKTTNTVLENVNAFYNLNTKKIEIQNSNNVKLNYLIYDIHGRVLFQQQNNLLEQNIEMSAMNAGFYVLFIEDESGRAYFKKIMHL